MSGDPIYTVLDLGENESHGEKDFNISTFLNTTSMILTNWSQGEQYMYRTEESLYFFLKDGILTV